ncbi:hypothetical protein [Kitasatospora sp. NPDC094015]|uniref:hypothetical protein n=1 Tax=Kitasatospora sp. NPDC094015 TaxID=3155205 RepID=UPI0033257A1F
MTPGRATPLDAPAGALSQGAVAGAGPEAAAATPDPLRGLAGLRLRPGVAVTALRAGLHLRGRRSAVTLEGGAALPALWRLLAEPLRTGDTGPLDRQAPPGSPVRAALGTVLAQLRAHDLLVEPGDGTAGPWLLDAAERPADAAAALAAARPRVLGAEPGGPLAPAAVRALVRAGAAPSYAGRAGAAPGQVLLRTAGPAALAVAARVCGGTGFVTAPAGPEQALADAAALSARLGLDPAEPPAPVLAALVAGAAAQRLLCAVAGLPDPATEGEDPRLLPGRPAVLVAGTGPLRADHRPWLGGEPLDQDRAAPGAAPATLAEAMHRVAALGDERIGVLPAAEPGALPQLPAALASCAVAGDALLAGAPRTDLARLEALCRAAELRLGAVTVGADPGHAWGRALRRAAAAGSGRVGLGGPGGRPAELSAASWSADPQARHWWSTLTDRLGVRAELRVAPLAPGAAAFHAVVLGAGGRLLAEAVEATAADAAAFAALAATAGVQGAPHRPAHSWAAVRPVTCSGGAAAVLATAGARRAGWEDRRWTSGWLAEVASREPELQVALRRLTGLRAALRAPAGPDARTVATGLHGAGFTVLHTLGGPR